MIKLILFIIFVCALSLLAAWFAASPGVVTIRWQDYQIETSFALILLVTLLAVTLGLIGYHLLSLLFRVPGNVKRQISTHQQEQGLKALTQAMAALTLSDIATASKMTKKAEQLLHNAPVTLLLSAQLSKMQGDDSKAKHYLEEMLKNEETEYLAVRGLIENARKHNDYFLALAHAERAFALRPQNIWAALALVDLYSQVGRWQEALLIIEKSFKKGVFKKDEFKRYTALIHYQHGKKLLAEGEDSTALNFFVQSHTKLPDFVPAALHLAEMKKEAGKPEEAAKIIMESWRMNPHPALSELFLALYQGEAAGSLIKKTEKLIKHNATHIESRLALAKAAIQTKQWPLARTQLELVLKEEENRRACTLMAEIEEKENAAHAQASHWLMRAANAPAEATWLCDKCGYEATDWSIHCDHCGAFDSMGWKSKSYPYLPKPAT